MKFKIEFSTIKLKVIYFENALVNKIDLQVGFKKNYYTQIHQYFQSLLPFPYLYV